MVDPDLARPSRARGGEVLLCRNVASIRAPRRLIEQTKALLRHLTLVGTIYVHNPDIVAAAPVRGKGDPRPIGRKTRLHFPSEPLGNARRSTARNRHRVNIAEQ